MEVKFLPYFGYLMGLPKTSRHLIFRWTGEGKIVFSVARQGNAASCHFASDKKGLRSLKKACEEFVAFCFEIFSWCNMCIAHIKSGSLERLVSKLGFSFVGHSDKGLIYARLK